MEILLLVSFIVIAFILGSKLKSKGSTRNPPPGPWKLPLIGNIHNLIGDVPHRLLHQLAQKHGPVMQLQLGEVSAVVISSPDAAMEVMKTHDINFATRPSILAAEIMAYGCTNISTSPYGDYWRQLRKICTLELLSTKRVQSFRSLREKVYTDLSKRIASMEGSPLNLSKMLYSSTYSFIATAALGKTTQEEQLLPLIIKTIELASGLDIADLFPSVKLLPMMSGLRRKLIVMHEQTDRLVEEIFKQRRQEFAAKKIDEQESLLDVLLKFTDDRSDNNPLTNDNIKAVLLDMLGAGSETSATTMNWAMAEMVKNPTTLKKAQDEVRQVFDEQGYVDESRTHQLIYLKAVVKETLRLHPPAPLLIPRKCIQTCEINGYEIPAETRVIVNAWAINRHPDYWKNGHSFKPERFLDTPVDFRGNHLEYIPFGAGRRMCPGMNFGLANVELPLAMFLYHFDWELPFGMKPQEMDMAERFGLTANTKKDVFLVPLINRPLPRK